MTCVSRLTATTPASSRPRKNSTLGTWIRQVGTEDHDVIMTLSEVREGLPFQLISKHVKSHQDKERAFADLTRPEQLNVL
jgi:hypothetical protein